MPQLRIHLDGNLFADDDFNKAKQLAALFNQALFARLTCSGCQRILEIPIEVIERMPPNIMVTPAEEGVWHRIYNLAGAAEKWLCTECWIQFIASLPPPTR